MKHVLNDRRTLLGLALGLFVLSVPSLVPAADDEPTLDQMLDLSPSQPPQGDSGGAASNDEPGNTESTETSAETGEKTTRGEARDQAEDLDLLDQTKDQVENYKEAADRFEQAINEMADVSDRLTKAHDSAIETQRLQQRIIRELEQTIEAAKRMKQNQSSSASSSRASASKNSGSPRKPNGGKKPLQGKQNQPAESQKKKNKAGKTNEGNPLQGSPTASADNQKPLSELKREWGRLPARLRNELSDGLEEPFSPVYRRMTEAYYRRLAEESGE